jgi:hypothetical protein
MTDEFQRMTSADLAAALPKFAQLRAPRFQMTEGSDADIEYRLEAKVQYLIEVAEHLLQRIEMLEESTSSDDGDSGISSGGIDGPFDPNDRPWENN